MSDSPSKSPLQSHHIITRDVASKHRLLGKLKEFGLFELNASQNILNLPTTQELAAKIDVSPHTGGPLSSYQEGVAKQIQSLADTPDGLKTLAGDRAAAERVAGRVNTLRDTLKTALDKGHLFTNTPKNMTPEAINKLNQELLGKLDDYAIKHADAISKMGKLVGPEAEWTAVLKSSEAAEEVTKALQLSGKTGALNSFGAAIGQATEAGRFSPSTTLRGTLGTIFGASAKGLAKGLGVAGLGAAGALLDAEQSMAQAKELAANGDVEGANTVINGLGARLAFGWMGAQWGAAAGVGAGPYGALIGGALGGVAGVIGGEAAVKAIEKAAKEISEAIGMSSGEIAPVVSARQPETIFNPDGTKTITEFNPENNQPSSVKTYDKEGKLESQTETDYDPLTHTKVRESTFDGSGKPISLNEFTPHGDLRRRTDYDADGTKPYESYDVRYGASGKKETQTIRNDDGSRVDHEWDIRERKIAEITTAKDGSRSETRWDVDNQEGWDHYTVNKTAVGVRTAQTNWNDNGSRTDYRFDAQNRKTIQVNTNPDGSRSETRWDVDNKEGWDHYTVNKTAAGVRTTQANWNDNGSRTDYRFDAENRKTIQVNTNPDGSRNDFRFNPRGEIISRSDYAKNGKPTKITRWDRDQKQPWDSYEEIFDANGKKTGQTNRNDNGTRSDYSFNPKGEVTTRNDYDKHGKTTKITVWDRDNKYPWDRYEQTFGPDGKRTTQTNYNDDGTHSIYGYVKDGREYNTRNDYDKTGKRTKKTTWDRDKKQPWDRIEQPVGHDGKFTGSTHFNDDGTRNAYSYDKAGKAILEKSYDKSGAKTYDRVATARAVAEANAQLQQAFAAEAERLKTAATLQEAARQASSGRKVFPSGSTRDTDYDTGNQHSYARRDVYRDRKGKLVVTVDIMDNGTTIITQYTGRKNKELYQGTYDENGKTISSRGKFMTGMPPGLPFPVTTYSNYKLPKEAWDNQPAPPKGFSTPPGGYTKFIRSGGSAYNPGEEATPPPGLGGGGGSTGGGGPTLGSGPFPVAGPPTTGTFTPPPPGGWRNSVWGSNANPPTTYLPPIYPALSSKSAPPPWTPITQTPRIPQNIPAAGTPIFFVDVTTDNKIAVFQDANGNFFIKKSGMGSLPAPVGQKVGEGTFVPMPHGFDFSPASGTVYRGPAKLQGREFLLYENKHGNTIAVPVNPVRAPLMLELRGKRPATPVALDLDGDGELDIRPLGADTDPAEDANARQTVNKSSPRFDWNGDGAPDTSAWVSPNDGFLAIDLAAYGSAGPDGVINQPRELAFAIWKTEDEIAAENSESVTDLEGLRYAFDTNKDNVLDANDARWNEFRVWQDLNQNGISEDGELKTMPEAGIKLINLLPDPAGAKLFADGSFFSGTSTMEMTDGSTRLVADAALRFQPSTPHV